MSKYGPRVWPSEVIRTKGHWIVGTECGTWTATGSKGDTYTIKMVDGGFTCDCPAFRKCKHITLVEDRLCGLTA
jgi:hypothetical protein